MKKLLLIILSSVILLLISPAPSWACSICVMEMTEYAFPFLPLWVLLYILWFLLHLFWYLGSAIFKWRPPATKRKNLLIGFAGFLLLMLFTLFLPILFLWLFFIIKRIWRAKRMHPEALPNINRKAELYFNGIFAVLMIISVPFMYWQYHQPEQLISRLGPSAVENQIYNELISKGAKVIPYLREALKNGINNPDRESQRAANAARILGEMRDMESVDLLIKGLMITPKDGMDYKVDVLKRNCAKALVTIRGDKVVEGLIESLDSAEPREFVIDTLKKITGQNIGNNKQQWQKWWENNKTK